MRMIWKGKIQNRTDEAGVFILEMATRGLCEKAKMGEGMSQSDANLPRRRLPLWSATLEFTGMYSGSRGSGGEAILFSVLSSAHMPSRILVCLGSFSHSHTPGRTPQPVRSGHGTRH